MATQWPACQVHSPNHQKVPNVRQLGRVAKCLPLLTVQALAIYKLTGGVGLPTPTLQTNSQTQSRHVAVRNILCTDSTQGIGTSLPLSMP